MEEWFMEYFDVSNIDGILHIIGAITTLLTLLVVGQKSVKGLSWMYSTDESDFSDNAKLVLCELRQPLSQLTSNDFFSEEISTQKVCVTGRTGLFRRKPKVMVLDRLTDARTQKQSHRDISEKLTFPERRVIRRVVKSRLVDLKRKKEADDNLWVSRNLS